MKVPRLRPGRGYGGPEFYGCMNTGLRPAIIHSRSGKYVVGPELRCRDAMRRGITLQNVRVWGREPQRVWIYKTRSSAVAKFKALCESRINENQAMREKHAEAARKAAQGDVAATLALGDF